MARLIPRKQIEEVKDFLQDTSFAQNVIISGSLLVSQSVSIGNSLTDKSDITGSVEITGSLSIDGQLTFRNAQSRLDATASFSDESVNTQKFGGISVTEFGGSDATIFVSATRGNDANDGRSPQFPVRTIKRAAQIATPGDDGRYGLPTGSNFTGFRIDVDTGTYVEDNPIELPRNTTVWGSGLRVTKIVAGNENEDLFWVNSGCYLAEMTFAGLRVYPSVDNSQKGFAVAFAPNAFITTSPYVQNCSMISNQENSFLELYEDIPPGGGGLNVDGNRIHPDSPLASMVLDAYTQVAPNGVGCQVVGRGFIQLVSFFTNFSAYAVKVLDGGQAVLLNSNTSFGDYGMYASGSRFISGSGGNTEAFLNVQDNYSIIVNTIEGGLSTLPDLVPNTERGIKVTSELQYFVSEDSTPEAAEAVKSDFRLISNIVDSGITNIPALLAKSSTNGYGPTSIFNVSGNDQITSSLSVLSTDVDDVNTNFDIVLDIIERGNAATSSYVQQSNVSESIKVTETEQYKLSAITSDNLQIVSDRFDTIINIVKNGLTSVPAISDNNQNLIKVTETTQFLTDISSSFAVQQKVSSSFAIVYDIVQNGTGSAPTIVSSGSENPLIDYQNGYSILKENIDFIQEETIAFLSASWSEFDYNQETCKRDIQYIVSGAAHDLLYGGNEESVRNGNFYYLFPSDATTTQLDPTLTAIKYASGIAQKLVSDSVYVEPTADVEKGYNLIFNNKDFVRDETIAYISSSWSEFEYDESKCRRDIGYILDAVATDLKWGGNERSVEAGRFYYLYPSLAVVDNRTNGQLQQTLDALKYAKRITEKLLNNETFVTASESRRTIVDLIRQNRSLIQDETITYINTQYPNFTYNQTKCRRDTGYIVDAVATDILYGGNERSELAGLYYYRYPSIATTTQLTETLDGIDYAKGFTAKIANSEKIDTPQIVYNIDGRVKVTAFEPTTGSVSASDVEVAKVGTSFEIIKDIIRNGTDSTLAAIAVNDDSYTWSVSKPLNVTTNTQVTSSSQLSNNLIKLGDGFDIVTDIIGGGIDEAPTFVGTWEGNIKLSDTTQFVNTGSVAGVYEGNFVSQSISIVADIVQNGIDSLPTEILNTSQSIKVTDTNSVTLVDSGSVSEVSLVSSSFAIVLDVIENGTDVLPTEVKNSEGLIKFTSDTPTYDNSTYQAISKIFDPEYGIVTSSFDTILDIIENGIGVTPEFVGNDEAGIIVLGDSTQANIVGSGSLENLNFISSSIAIVSDIVQNGTGSYTASSYVTPSTDANTLIAYQILREPTNIELIKNETIAYLSSSWATGSYDEEKCKRDIGLIISGAAEDLIWGSVSASVVNGRFYYDFPSQAQDTQLEQTLDGINYASRLAQNLVRNIELVGPPQNLQGYSDALGVQQFLFDNTEFIQNETIAYLSSSWSTFDYNEEKCRRDVSHIIRAVATDTVYGGNERSIKAGTFYYKFPSQATGSQLQQTLDGIRYAKELSLGIIQNFNFSLPSTDVSASYALLKSNTEFIQEETIAYLSSSWSTFDYNETTCKRDVGYIIDAVATDLWYGGNERSRTAGEYYYLYPSQATTTQLDQTLDGVNYARRLAEKVIVNTTFQSPTQASLDAKELLLENKELIQNEVIEFVSSSWSEFDYNSVTCKRDVGFILDATITDLVYGGNERSRIAAEFYYKYPSAAVVGGVPSSTQQKDPTVDAIKYLGGLSEEIVLGSALTSPSSDIISLRDLVFDNKSFVQQQTIDYINDTYPNLNYNNDKCYRDVGFIIDAVLTDLVYGGNARSIQAGEFYYRFPNKATDSQLSETIDGIDFARDLVQSIGLGIKSIEDNFDTIVKIIESGSSIVTEEEGFVDGIPIATIGTPKNSYGDLLTQTVIGTQLPDDVTIVKNIEGGIKFGNDNQYTSSISVSSSEISKVSSSFSIITDIIEYGITGSTVLEGAASKTTYFEVVTLNPTDDAYYINQNQLDNFDNVNTSSIVDSLPNPTLTLKRGELYSFSVNSLNEVKPIFDEVEPFLIKTRISTDDEYTYNKGITNNGLSFGTLLFVVPLDAPDTLYYMNGRNLSASGQINIVDELPLEDGQRYVEIPSKGEYEIIPNTLENIKVSDTTQYFADNSSSLSDRLIVSEGFERVINILNDGVDTLPTLVENVDTNIKATSQTQTLSSQYSASNSEVTIVSSSFATVIDVIKNGVGVIPTLVENTSANIKVTNVNQIVGAVSGTLENIDFISSSFAIVSEIVTNGTGSYLSASNYESASTDLSTIAAYQTLRSNIPFIQSETIAYLSSSWSGFVYNEASCSRDIGLIVSGAAEDLIWNTPSASIVNGRFYYDFPSEATGSQLTQTLDGINYASRLAQKVIQNIVFQSPSNEVSASQASLLANRTFIQEETIAYLSSSWSSFEYNEDTCKRDVGYIVDAVRTDLTYGGNERTIEAGRFYYLYPSQATDSQLTQTVDGVNYARRLSEKIVQNETFVTASESKRNGHELLLQNRGLIQNEVIAYISSSWGDFEYNEASCSRDTGYIVDAVATDLLYGGNERTIEAGKFYYLYPSEATGSQLTQTTDGIRYAQRLANKIVSHTTLVTASLERRTAHELIRENKSLIQNEVISYISSSWSGFEYNESKCRRDVGYILDAVRTDVLYGGNERSVTAGEFYYLYPSQATSTQLDQTLDGVNHAAGLANKIIQNTLLVSPDSDVRNAYNLLVENRRFIQDNVVEFTDVTFPYLGYNREKCRRDVGYIIDAVATDLLWGGNERSVIAGDYYYRFPSQATDYQLDETTFAIRYAKAMAKNVMLNRTLVTPLRVSNFEGNIKATDTPQYTGSIAISGSYLTEISSSYAIVSDVIANGLGVLPTEVRNIEGLIKTTNTTQTLLSVSGSETEVGIVTSSVSMINDIIRLGSDNIPLSIAKWFQTSELDTPQNLTTGRYTAVAGNYEVGNELAIVTGSFLQINDIITNGTSSLPTLVTNAESNIKVTTQSQFSSSINGSQTEIDIVDERAGLIENIVQNGTSVIPTLIENNTDTNNLIKVTDVPQYVSASAATKLQSKIVSSSFGTVIDILTNGTGSLPTIVEYTEAIDELDTKVAYGLLKNNIPFIQSETIAFMSSSWSNFAYNEASCSRDVGLIVSGAAEDLIWNSNSASVMNGYYYYLFPSEATGSQLDQTVTAIRYASNLAQNIVRNRVYSEPSAEVSASYELLVQNKEFIKEETIAFVSSSWSDFDYNQDTCKRDVGYIIDAVATDLLYNGNERSITAGRYYYDYPSAAIVGGVPSATQQKDPTVTAINYVRNLATELVGGAIFQTASAEVEYVYDSIRENREFIQNETIAFVNAKYPDLQYNEASCSRDTGFIVDAVATDLRWGGNQRSREAGRFYYLFPSKATNVQLGETTDAVVYASDLVKEIVLKNTLSIPTASLNTDNGIKVTSEVQTLGTGTTEVSVVNAVSSSFGIVMDIVTNGTGSLPSISAYTASIGDSDTLEAYSLLKANIPFIQAETIAYISSSWSEFPYNEASCSRDVGLIVSGAAEDLLFGSISSSVMNGYYYYLFPSEATGSQLNQTLDGIRFAAGLANKVIQNVELQYPSTEASASWELLRANKEFIQNESIAYLSSSWSSFGYDQTTCKRDIGYIVDAVATDIKYGGTQRSVTAGDFYYKYPSNATTSELEPTTTGIGYAGNMMEKVIVNDEFVTPSADRIAGHTTLLQNRTFIQNEVIAYISSSWADFEYNEASCSRDTGYIVDAVATDFLYGGNERSRTAGEFYYLYPSEATTTQANQTTDGVNYASGISQRLVQNIEYVTVSNEVSASWNLLRDNKQFIQEEVIAYVSSSWSGVYYDETKCKRDVGYLIDAAATDLYYGGNDRSIVAAEYYFRYPSAATERGTPSAVAQLDPTTDGIVYAGGLAKTVIQNLSFTEPSAAILVGADLLIGNKTFIQKETIAYLSSSWSEFDYNEVSCSRDIGYMIDAVRTDLVYGGNERSIKAGEFYYYIPSVAITEQKPQTLDGINFAKGVAEKVILKDQLVFPSLNKRNGAAELRANKKDLQAKAISYTNAAFPDFEYKEEKCYRDTGFILDAIVTDMTYGGNERSIAAASSYYNGVYGDASVVVNEQKKETAETNRYLRTLFQKVARKSPLELFGSLIITTGHDFSYAGSGVTYKALPPNQGGAGVPDPTKEIVELAGGRVFFTSGNELGDFRIGTGLVINQATGTLQGRTFSRSLFSLVTPFSLALEA